MSRIPSPKFILPLCLVLLAVPVAAQKKDKTCFTPQARALAEQKARVWEAPDPGYDPVLGYNPATGPRRGAPEVDQNGLAGYSRITEVEAY